VDVMKGSDGRYLIKIIGAGDDELVDLGNAEPAKADIVRELKRASSIFSEWKQNNLIYTTLPSTAPQ